LNLAQESLRVEVRPVGGFQGLEKTHSRREPRARRIVHVEVRQEMEARRQVDDLDPSGSVGGDPEGRWVRDEEVERIVLLGALVLDPGTSFERRRGTEHIQAQQPPRTSFRARRVTRAAIQQGGSDPETVDPEPGASRATIAAAEDFRIGRQELRWLAGSVEKLVAVRGDDDGQTRKDPEKDR
jgi:hypothetical protein